MLSTNGVAIVTKEYGALEARQSPWAWSGSDEAPRAKPALQRDARTLKGEEVLIGAGL